MNRYFYARVGGDGRVLGQVDAVLPRWDAVTPSPGERHVPLAAMLPDLASVWFLDGEIKPIGQPPSDSHTFDPARREWVLDDAAAWGAVRVERDLRLLACDWVTLRATDQGTPVPPEWLAYRQALRDITDQGDPLTITWPVAPAA